MKIYKCHRHTKT